MTHESQPRFRIEKLLPGHGVDAFDCGQDSLNRYLKGYALANQHAEGARTYVGLYGEDIIGFYTLVVGNVAYGDAPERLLKGFPASLSR